MDLIGRLIQVERETARRRLHKLVPIDLPVDLVVVLEQQERANQTQRSEEALAECWRVR
jgi:hypothetical protein